MDTGRNRRKKKDSERGKKKLQVLYQVESQLTKRTVLNRQNLGIPVIRWVRWLSQPLECGDRKENKQNGFLSIE